MGATPTVNRRPIVSVVIPARNEEVCLGDCLTSIVSQGEVDFEIIVVNDHSIDRTREIAQSFTGVRVIEAAPLPAGWTGKNNAVTTGARQAQGDWLLFTDADTVHLPGSLTRALAEARENNVDLLSYSPEQIALTFWEMAVLPVVFSELARQYPLAKVSDPNSPAAAANGQYILIKHDVYSAIGGHAAIAADILEDVALARAAKSGGFKIRFRYGADAVRTRMYRNYNQLRDGWTKNLALLFPTPGALAVKTLALWLAPWIMFLSAYELAGGKKTVVAGFLHLKAWEPAALGFASLFYLAARIGRSNFPGKMRPLAAIVGMPMFAYLLLRSRIAHARGAISWKGRTYSDRGPDADKASVLATGH